MALLSHDSIHRIFDGTDRSLKGRSLRGITAVAEPFYAAVMRTRNLFYARGIFQSHLLGRPTISVGNITTGGTGKTPVVGWLAARLRDAGRRPAILLRGYRASEVGISDEQQVLDRTLNLGSMQSIPVRANPDRIQSATQLLNEQANIDTFVLDDAFQHRKARRNFDLVLISATEPFGFGHVLPRGMLRESMDGLKRADAFLITRCSQADEKSLQEIQTELARYQPEAPIYRADHVHTAIRSGASGERMPIESLSGKKFYAFTGIANPAAFDQQLRSLQGEYAGHEWFPDHHAYIEADVQRISRQALAVGVDQLLTTEKDWVKIVALSKVQEIELPIGVLELSIRFHVQDDDRLFAQILASIK
jgi:tetraacyldisaccharide 4'-kinase